MKASYTSAVRYRIDAECLTPLRTGNEYNETELVLRREDGRPFIQATSLAGAMRAWLEKADRSGVYAAEDLFGSRQKAGRLILSDGVFEASANQYLRPRLAIDGKTGTAKKHLKFDIASIGAGEKFHFELVWLGDEASRNELADTEQLLAALDAGEILLGAQKTNGFGRVRITARKQSYDLLHSAADREAWLNDSFTGKALTLPALAQRRHVRFVLTGRADSILVKAGAAEHRKKDSCTGNLTENGRAILPGSSVKGAVRAQAERICRLSGKPEHVIAALFGSCGTDEAEGSAGRVTFSDMQLTGEPSPTARIRVDRFTGGVMQTGLFKEAPAASEIRLEIEAPEQDAAGCGLLLYALRDLGLGLYNLGSGGAIGRGYVQVREIAVSAPDGRMASLTFAADGRITQKDDRGLFAEWLNAFGEAEQ